MNRLISAPHISVTPPKSGVASALRQPRELSRSVPRVDLPQCLLVPQHYERNYAYPLLVWLHDCGGREQELKQIMPLVSLRNYVSLAVRGTRKVDSGFGWEETAEAIAEAETRVAEAVAAATRRFNVHRDRVFLAGAGAGGTMALRLALRAPERLAGGVSIGGCFPQGHSPLARLAAARNLKLLMMHCRDSQTYATEQVCRELSLFHAAGLSVTLRQYPCGDELTTQMLRDLDVWLMEQVTGVASEAHEPAISSEWN